MRDYRSIPLWSDVSQEQWNDWTWQIAHRLTTLAELRQVVHLSPAEEQGVVRCLSLLRMAITPFFSTLMDPDNPVCPLRRQAIPTVQELYCAPEDMADPLSEDEHSPAPGLIHRYPDRVLFLVTDRCAMYCRHCTRRRLAGVRDQARSCDELDQALAYIERTPVVRDVLLSGGDALILPDEQLQYILERLRRIPHVEIVRVGTRVPITLPQRITPQLAQILRQHHPLYVNIHCNHPAEITPQAASACALLADAGIPLGSQTVLLRGINDCPQVMQQLMHKLLQIRVRPYYIYQCDLAQGISHFRTPISTGIQIIESLRGHTSGLAVPSYVVDAPGGGGKIPLQPQYLLSQSSHRAVLRNFEGTICTYTEPSDPSRHSACVRCSHPHHADLTGVAAMLCGPIQRNK
ncbi:MAG: lysine 2,3-aminomutase [Bacillota bacterium]